VAANPKQLFRSPLRRLYDAGTAVGLTDGQLLERFATRRDEGAELAFAALVERHGAMVLRTCRGILRDHHDAMDAFQATFLVLARKGGSLWVLDSIGPWLHRVACRAAVRARNTTARRRAVEKGATEMAGAEDGGDRAEIASIIHEEIDRLPERYRAPVVLCDLEGRTCEQAARHIGCPVGTVASRLARGRVRLRDRLRRRGLAPGAGAVVVLPKGPGLLESIPPGLVDSTAAIATRFVSTRAVLHGTAVSIAREVLGSMAISRTWKAASIVLALGASASGVVSFAVRGGTVAEPRSDDPPAHARAGDDTFSAVKPGKLSVVVQERGNLEASRMATVINEVEGGATIIWILPEGSKVTKGQPICELDSAVLRDRLRSEQTSVRDAEVAFRVAKISREVAEGAVKEYQEGVYPTDRMIASGEIARALLAIATAQEQLKRTRTARERLNSILSAQGGAKTSADVMAELALEDRADVAEAALGRERTALEIGQNKLESLEKFTKDIMLNRLRADVEKARHLELSGKNAWELGRSKEERLERQIASCRIVAPADGILVYANGPPHFSGKPGLLIEEGATVRERQVLFTIPDLAAPMRVNTKIHESQVDRLVTGQRVRVKVDAFSDLTFDGVVDAIAPLADAPSSFGSNAKSYTAYVNIVKAVPSMRPGMSAAVEILVADLPDAISVPVAAVAYYDEKDHVAVKAPDGKIDWREVTLGVSDGKRVEVKSGLKPGDNVAVDCGPLLSEEQKQKISAPATRPAARAKAKAKGAGLPAALRAKLQAIGAEDRLRLRDAGPEARDAILKKAGFTDEEVRQFRQQTVIPR
jgi:HlyD family secretion protein